MGTGQKVVRKVQLSFQLWWDKTKIKKKKIWLHYYLIDNSLKKWEQVLEISDSVKALKNESSWWRLSSRLCKDDFNICYLL